MAERMDSLIRTVQKYGLLLPEEAQGTLVFEGKPLRAFVKAKGADLEGLKAHWLERYGPRVATKKPLAVLRDILKEAGCPKGKTGINGREARLNKSRGPAPKIKARFSPKMTRMLATVKKKRRAAQLAQDQAVARRLDEELNEYKTPVKGDDDEKRHHSEGSEGASDAGDDVDEQEEDEDVDVEGLSDDDGTFRGREVDDSGAPPLVDEDRNDRTPNVPVDQAAVMSAQLASLAAAMASTNEFLRRGELERKEQAAELAAMRQELAAIKAAPVAHPGAGEAPPAGKHGANKRSKPSDARDQAVEGQVAPDGGDSPSSSSSSSGSSSESDSDEGGVAALEQKKRKRGSGRPVVELSPGAAQVKQVAVDSLQVSLSGVCIFVGAGATRGRQVECGSSCCCCAPPCIVGLVRTARSGL